MFKLSSSYGNELQKDSRIDSIDVLRGLVMLLMALDHCRDFFHIYAAQYSPEDLNNTTPIVFYTRIITHICAPVFAFLTGVSAFLYAYKKKRSKNELAKYLLVRGLILILLEVTIVRFAWRFYIDYSSIGGLVIWALGWSMIALAGLIYLPRKIILIISLTIIFLHNLLDSVSLDNNVLTDLLWSFLHKQKFVALTDHFGVNILYPVLPMIALMALGYYMGKWFTPEYSHEIRIGYFLNLGMAMIFLFICLRFMQIFTEQYSYVFYLKPEDIEEGRQWTVFFKKIFRHLMENYGDPSAWTMQEDITYTTIAFFNTTKYPMSLLYILMTMGPAFIFLALIENKAPWFTRIMKTYGKVPLFYYVVHLFVVHALAVVLAILTNLDKVKAILEGNMSMKSLAADYGFSIPVVYLIWLFVVVLMYPMCRAYGKLKSAGKYKILSYL